MLKYKIQLQFVYQSTCYINLHGACGSGRLSHATEVNVSHFNVVLENNFGYSHSCT